MAMTNICTVKHAIDGTREPLFQASASPSGLMSPQHPASSKDPALGQPMSFSFCTRRSKSKRSLRVIAKAADIGYCSIRRPEKLHDVVLKDVTCLQW